MQVVKATRKRGWEGGGRRGGGRVGGGQGARDPLATQAADCSSLAFLGSPVTLWRHWRVPVTITALITC